MHDRINLKPSIEEKRTWGLLAHVSEEERNRILKVPSGQFQRELKSIERDIKDKTKRENAKKRTTLQYTNYTPQLPSTVQEWHKRMKAQQGEKDDDDSVPF